MQNVYIHSRGEGKKILEERSLEGCNGLSNCNELRKSPELKIIEGWEIMQEMCIAVLVLVLL